MKKAFPRLKSNPKSEGCRRPRGKGPFFNECCKVLRNLPGSSDLSRSTKKQHRELVVDTASDPLKEWLSWSRDEIPSQWNWAPGSGFLNNNLAARSGRGTPHRLGFQGGLGRCPTALSAAVFLEETALHAFYYWERVRSFWSHVGEWMVRIDPKQLVLLDVGYVEDNVDPPWKGEKRAVFLAIPAVARMEIWETRMKGLYDGANFSLYNMILFFRHQLRVKIRSDRKRLGSITFDRRWVLAVSMVVQKGTKSVSFFPPLLFLWLQRTRFFGIPPQVSLVFVSHFPNWPHHLVSEISWFLYIFASLYRSDSCPTPDTLFCPNSFSSTLGPSFLFPSPGKQSAFQF